MAGEMMKQLKEYYEKMIDFKNFGIVMLAVGIMFFIGTVLPSAEINQSETIVLIVAAIVFLSGSVLFFNYSKEYRQKLLQSKEGQEYLNK
jgi:predicted MFS family arabinose efflux permease